MRFLLDQDVYSATAPFLRALGHDVLTAEDLGLWHSVDLVLLEVARVLGRVLVTRDRHFGRLVFVGRLGSGVIYLRMPPPDTAEVHAELARALSLHTEDELRRAFVVVEPGKHRFRRV